jgi:hypothetical protein
MYDKCIIIKLYFTQFCKMIFWNTECISKFYIYQLMHKWIVFKTILKSTLKLIFKQLQPQHRINNTDVF